MAKKILFVDDDPDWRSMAGTWLHGAGYAVVTAGNTRDTLLRIQGSEPDLVVVDIHLADEDGIELMKLLKQEHPKLPVILFTGFDHDDDTILDFIQQGAYQYVRKGKMSDLVKTVQMLLDYDDGR